MLHTLNQQRLILLRDYLLPCPCDRQIITITRRNQLDRAIITADELCSLLESVYVLRSPANAKRLFRSMGCVSIFFFDGAENLAPHHHLQLRSGG
jgi:hypothetical protein